MCFTCKAPLLGEYSTALGHSYHKECFVCGHCRRLIQGKFFSNELGDPVCNACEDARAPKCRGCCQAIRGTVVTVGAEQFHSECFICRGCRNVISGSYFKDKPESGNDGYLCPSCNETEHPPKRCAGCCRAIIGQSLTSEGRPFHPECFVCTKCRRSIEGAFFRTEDGQGRLCSACQPCCDACGSKLGNERSIRVGQLKLHAACFRCSACQLVLEGRYFEVRSTNPFQASTEAYRCQACEAAALQAGVDAKERHAVAKEDRLKRRNTVDFTLCWRPELTPCSRQALQDLGLPQRSLPRDGFVCLCYDKALGRVFCGQASHAHPEAAVSISYLACVLRVLRDQRCEPRFSLDAKDPHDIGGEHLLKRFYPSWLASTVVGEVLFQADYALKQLCFGDQRLPGLPNIWDDRDQRSGSDEPRAARQWFTIQAAKLTVAADGCLVPHVQLCVEARRLVPSPTGFTDASYTDPSDLFVRQAAAVSARFHEVAAQLPVVGELLSLARATVLAVHLLSRGCRRNDAALDKYTLPLVPEGEDYQLQIPTLTKQRTSSVVCQEDDNGSRGRLVVKSLARRMQGGVDLTVPKQVPMTATKERIFDMRVQPVMLPLFLPAAAGAA